MIRSDEEAEAKPVESDHLRPKSVVFLFLSSPIKPVFTRRFYLFPLKKEPDMK